MIVGSFLRDIDFINSAYLVASVLFILGIRGLSHPRTARQGNILASIGMLIAVVATLLHPDVENYGLIAVGIAIGAVIGAVSARAVKMTAMPQMVALFNGVGGGAVALVALSEYHELIPEPGEIPLETLLPTLLACVIGAVSFSGSLIAFAKLQELMTGRPIVFPGNQFVNGALVLGIVGLIFYLATGEESEGLFVLMLCAALVFGVLLIIPVGGADMPVVISMLNAFTGLSAAGAGFVLDNNSLIIAGSLVGSSGTLLTILMGRAMNRSLSNVLFSAFGSAVAAGPAGEAETRPVKDVTPADVATMLAYADKVIVVPGYGLAVAQAQHSVRELADELEKRGVEVNYAIHPVAGRMPGHMNVLLAEADVPYDALKEMDEINPDFPQTDVALVIGANDVTNPAARSNESSPIYGMPILDVDKAHQVVVLKRSMNPGFAGIENELYYGENTVMLFGDAKDSVTKLVGEVKTA
ncbi:MAG TPA: NAD(P)(+) transhydrogenase (Re/Si-specific) subunit beta [Solirubrobacterales bacterium]|nr:NAD(P)(+) transhydrogenase (Re/Si-specific) subunit beta [Solirubrobacterales bacterium]